VNILYGTSPAKGQLIYHAVQGDSVLIKETDKPLIYDIDRSQLIEAVEEKGIVQDYYCRLWVVVSTTTKEEFIRYIFIDRSIIEKNKYKPAQHYIAADLFLGFKQLESKTPQHMSSSRR
jgi:hypothetical protein